MLRTSANKFSATSKQTLIAFMAQLFGLSGVIAVTKKKNDKKN